MTCVASDCRVSVPCAVICDAESSSVRYVRLDTGAVTNMVGGAHDPTVSIDSLIVLCWSVAAVQFDSLIVLC